MNDKRKEYLKKWREDNKEHIRHYKKEYAKTHDSSFKKLQDKYKQLQQENKQLKSILTDLEKWCNDGIKDELVKFDYGTEIIGTPIKIHITSYEMILDKMQELEQGSDK